MRITLAEGVRRGGCSVQRRSWKYGGKPTSPWAAPRAMWAQPPLRHAEVHLPYARRAPGLRICRRVRATSAASSPTRSARRGWRLSRKPAGVRAVGHRVGVLELRLHEPYGWWTARSAPTSFILVDPRMTPLGKGKPTCGCRCAELDLCLSLGWPEVDPRQRGVRRRVRAPLDERPFLWNPEKDGRTAKVEWFMK